MTETSRSRILAGIRKSAHSLSGEALQRDLQSLGRAPAADLPSGDLTVAFLANVLKNRGTVDCARNRSETVKAIGHYIYQHYRTHRLVAGNDPRLAALPWRDGGVLPRFGSIEEGEPVSLSYARLGVAETGATVTFTGRGNPGANNMLAEHHIVLVDSDELVTDMEQAWQRIAQIAAREGRPRGINFIAGPSSTADIEGQLVYGAHGPNSWHVILLGDIPDTALEDAQRLSGG